MYPIIALSVSGLLTLFLGFLDNKKLVFPLSIFFLIVALGVSFVDWNAPGLYFSGMLAVNNESIIFGSIILVSAILILCLSEGFDDFEFAQPAEYFALVQLSLVGALMMVSFENLLMLFLGIEILSIGLYILTGADKRNLRGNEAAIKYFLMGAFATGIFLFGIAMFYGAVGTFDIHTAFSSEIQLPFLYIGCTLILIGLTFKVSAAPFHFWSPDVYEGAPTIFTAYMATVVKTAGFVAIYKVLSSAFSHISEFWVPMLMIMVVISLIVGNVFAVTQDSFKRLMAYSSISHAGFMLLALIGGSQNAIGTIMFYSVAYSLATITAFGVLMKVSKHRIEKGRPYEKVDLFSGLAKENGFLATVLTIAMLSLAGIPLTAGFWGKFFVFTNAVTFKGGFAIIILAVVMSAVAVYYYFKPVVLSFKKEDGVEKVILTPLVRLVLILTTTGTLLLGIFPNILRFLF